MSTQLNTRIEDEIAANVRDLSAHSAIPISTIVEAMIAVRFGLPHPYEKAVYLATQRWKEGTES